MPFVFCLQHTATLNHLQSTSRPAPPSSSAPGAAPWHRRVAAATQRVCLADELRRAEAPSLGIPLISFLKGNCPSGYLWLFMVVSGLFMVIYGNL